MAVRRHRMTPGYVRGFSVWLLLWWLLAGLVKLTVRFVVGSHLDGKRRSDATFWTKGNGPIEAVPEYWGLGRPTWWALLAGWQRALIRWATVAAMVAYWRWPEPTQVGLVAAGGAAGIYGTCRVIGTIQGKERRRTVQSLYTKSVRYLKTDPDDAPDKWWTVPYDWRSNRKAEVRLTYPPDFHPTPAIQAALNDLVRRLLGGDWDAPEDNWAADEAVWRRAPEPPRLVRVSDLDVDQYDIHTIPVGMGCRDRVITVNQLRESPHWFVTAGTGGGKTTILSWGGAWVRQHGGLVDVIDLRMTSYADSLAGVPGVRIHTDMKSAVWALSEFFVSMVGANEQVAAGVRDAKTQTPRYLIVDEFGSLMRLAQAWWTMQGKKGKAPFLNAFSLILYQGRMAEHRVMVGVHQPKASLFGSTDERDLFATRMMLGAFTAQKHRMTFGNAERVDYDAKIPGRGVIGLGEDYIEQCQYLYATPKETQALARTGPPPPEWFTRHELPPWVTQATLDRVAEEVGITWLSLPGTRTDENGTRAAEKAGEDPSMPPGSVPPSAEPPPTTEQPASDAAARAVGANDDGLIVGQRAAAAYLSAAGWPMTTKQFTEARKKYAKTHGKIPGEQTVEAANGQHRPAWKPADLLAWQESRPIAGQRRNRRKGA